MRTWCEMFKHEWNLRKKNGVIFLRRINDKQKTVLLKVLFQGAEKKNPSNSQQRSGFFFTKVRGELVEEQEEVMKN